MKSRTLYINDKITTEDAKIKLAASECELYQIINESMHTLDNILFCTDLIFTSDPNLNMFIHLYTQTTITKLN